MTRFTPTRTLHDAILTSCDEGENHNTHDLKNAYRCQQPKWRLSNKRRGVFRFKFSLRSLLDRKDATKEEKGQGKEKEEEGWQV